MGTEAIGYVIGQQCAPVLAGVKPSNLLIVEQGNHNVLHHVLKGTTIRRCLLYASGQKDYWFLYDEETLCTLIHQKAAGEFLMECGYAQENLAQILDRLAVRFSQYKRGEAEFPHEMGVLLGYPLNDVRGFIENKGQNFRMSGYWKVYDDVSYADRVFKLYQQVRGFVLELWSQGVCLPDICHRCRMAGYQL
jgi:hypothetical protein